MLNKQYTDQLISRAAREFENFENGAYHDTMGVIEQCSGGLADIAPALQRIASERGIATATMKPEPVLRDYTLTYEEVVQHEFRFRACSFDAVNDEFVEAANNSELDYTNGYQIDSRIVKVVCNDDNEEEHWDISHAELEELIISLEKRCEELEKKLEQATYNFGCEYEDDNL